MANNREDQTSADLNRPEQSRRAAKRQNWICSEHWLIVEALSDRTTDVSSPVMQPIVSIQLQCRYDYFWKVLILETWVRLEKVDLDVNWSAFQCISVFVFRLMCLLSESNRDLKTDRIISRFGSHEFGWVSQRSNKCWNTSDSYRLTLFMTQFGAEK